MPIKSKAQQRWMFATHPKMAKEWAKETNFSTLPDRIKKKKKKKELGGPIDPITDPTGYAVQQAAIQMQMLKTAYSGMHQNSTITAKDHIGNTDVWNGKGKRVGKYRGQQYIEDKPNDTPFDWGQALRLGTLGLSEMSGRVDRGRQNQYMYDQFSAMGQQDPMPYQDFQPNPYKLYAKYGGSIKKQKEVAKKAMGGYSKQDIYKFLFDDNDQEDVKAPEVKSEQVPTAPSQKDLEEYYRNRRSKEQAGQEEDIAMGIVNQPFQRTTRAERKITPPTVQHNSSGDVELNPNVVAASKELQDRFPRLKVTSTIRNWGDKDAHPKGRAIDLAGPDTDAAWKYYKETIVPKYGFNPALDPNHGTGKHIHVGYYHLGGKVHEDDGKISKKRAKQAVKEDEILGHPLSKRQRHYFKHIISGEITFDKKGVMHKHPKK